MKIVVLGGSGLVGSKVVDRLRTMGQGVVAASRVSGVDIVTGVGLDAAMSGADAVVDVTNVSDIDGLDAAALFVPGGKNVAAAEKRAGVRHHVALSIVGADRVRSSGYLGLLSL